ncbi:hypothetical protein J132_10669 [Termitomyces sp. J132]|nr:hypothetical protein J132_10669 [Termitomyces sp. J132]
MLLLIVNNCKNLIGLGVRMGGTAAEAWKATAYTEGANFLAHLTDLYSKLQEAVEKGAIIGDAIFCTIVINSLPESWNTIVASLYSITISTSLIAKLTMHWECLRMQRQNASVTTTALQESTKFPQSKLVCINLNCKHIGHTIKSCYWSGGGKEGQFPQSFCNHESALVALEAPKAGQTPTANLVDTS